jgi:hypothetical protein
MPITHAIVLHAAEEKLEGSLLQHEVVWREGRPRCRLELTYSDQTVEGIATDWFQALIEIRKQIEPRGVRLHVWGASRNVWPSGMARDMGLGRSAYRMQMGKPAERTDLVNVFATGPGIEPVTIAEQESFKDEWFASIERSA